MSEPNLTTTSDAEEQLRIAMSANASSPWSGNHEPLSMDGMGEAPPAYARVHRGNGHNSNVLEIASEGDFWRGMAELGLWTIGPMLSRLFERQNELERQRNALDRQLDKVSQLIRYLALNLQGSEEAAMHQSPANEPREQWRQYQQQQQQQQQRRETVQRGESPGRGQVFEQPAPLGTMAAGVAPLVGTTPGADIQDDSGAEPDIWQVVAPWGAVGVSHRNTHMG
ncbi:hypothetical protein F5144DRAFT_637295 [Chaetomium tenue]|uniref:Uncharacterized protein n=1 Tax=Chaetomium tenue TaxID=1854479 RepID=A0ACB7PMK8_9PEZI|nr:hypothetical protein F5144DRAFT_637295 [Chaetomium globosum]